MNYRLINRTTGKETMCSKVVINGFDYYVTDDNVKNCYHIMVSEHGASEVFHTDKIKPVECSKRVVATYEPSNKLPVVVDMVEELAWETINTKSSLRTDWDKIIGFTGFVDGYYQSQESHPFSEEDMIQFTEWVCNSKLHGYSKQLYEAMIIHKVSTTKELLQIWKEQKPKTIYYE